MIKTSHILKLAALNKNVKNSTYLSVLTNDRVSGGILLGTPGLVEKNYHENKNEQTSLLFPFPSRYMGKPGHSLVISKQKYFVIDKPPLSERHEIKKIEMLSDKLIEEIVHKTKEEKAISYIVKDLQAQGQSIYVIRDIINKFKYHSVFSFNNGNPIKIEEKSNDETVTIFTFYSLVDCISIFNKRKVDGFGISINNVSKNTVIKLGYIPNYNEWTNIHVLVSNYIDNAFEVDGSAINIIESVCEGTYEAMAKRVSNINLYKKDISRKKMIKDTFIEGSYYTSTTATFGYRY